MNLEQIIIDRASHIPIAEQIANRLLKCILDSELRLGERLPPERELAAYLGVSRGTVKRAYNRLAGTKVIDIRQGSGSYVLKNGRLLEENQKEAAAQTIAATFARLRDMGLSEEEIISLVNLHYLNISSKNLFHKKTIMVVSNNHDILSELERQLSYLTESSPFLFTLFFLTLDTIARNPDPVQMLLGYDKIIATSIDYPDIVRIAPMFKSKILQANISPRTRTLVRLSELPSDSRFSVIYRTCVFRNMVEDCLVSMEFQPENIFYYHEKDYDPDEHDNNGINVVINFNESPVYSPDFAQRNQRFLERGGQIVRFEYQIERGSLIHIEGQIQQMVQDERAAR